MLPQWGNLPKECYLRYGNGVLTSRPGAPVFKLRPLEGELEGWKSKLLLTILQIGDNGDRSNILLNASANEEWVFWMYVPCHIVLSRPYRLSSSPGGTLSSLHGARRSNAVEPSPSLDRLYIDPAAA